MAELNNVVQETTEYDKFQKLMANRDISRNHLNGLKAAIQQHPEILKVQPILVNEHLYIIDGQHRFQAAMELGLPVAYTVVPGIGIEVARQMNILQRRWTPRDFAKSYAMGGNKHYRAYLQAMDDYEGLNHSTVLLALRGVGLGEGGGLSSEFRRGDFEVGDLTEARKNLDRLLEIREIITIAMTNPLAAAFLQVFTVADFNYTRLIQRLRLAPKTMLHSATNKHDYLRMIEDIYNYDMSDKNRKRLF